MDAGRRAVHATKQSDLMQRPEDNYTIDPETGDVFDPSGEHIGNAADFVGRKR